MRNGTLRRHRAIGVAALLASGGFIIAACSPATEEGVAPVYLMGTVAPDTFGKVSPVMRQSLASAPIERTEIAATATPTGEPIALAPSLTASAAAVQPASDVIPLDDPPALAKPAAKPALLVANPAPMSARFMPAPNLSASMLEPAPAETAAPKPETPPIAAASAPPARIAAPQPVATVVVPPRTEPSAAELARAEPAPVPASAPAPAPAPAPQPITAMTQPAAAMAPPVISAEPARGDIATTGVAVSARDDHADRYRPRYYYAP
jgi:hypothetical protein